METGETNPQRPSFDSWGHGMTGSQPASDPSPPRAEPPSVARGGLAMVAGVAVAVVALIRLPALDLGSGDAAASYSIGGVTGTVALLAAAAWLFVWGLRRARSGGAAPPAFASTSRPRWATVAAVAILSLAGAGALVSLLTGGTSNQAAATGWSSTAGINTHAGWVDGCNRSGAGTVDCECAFARITATPPYTTPAGFNTLAIATRRYGQTRNPADLPHVLVAAVKSCRTTA